MQKQSFIIILLFSSISTFCMLRTIEYDPTVKNIKKYNTKFSIIEKDFPKLSTIIDGETLKKKIGNHFVSLENKIDLSGNKRVNISSPITTITKSYITSIKNLIKNETTVDLQNAALVKKNYHQHFLFVREKNLHKYEKNYEILVEKKTINTLREERTKIETLQKKYNRSLKEVYLNTELVKTEEFLEKINSYSFSKKSLRKKVSTEHHTAQAGCCKVCSLYCCAFSFIFSLKVIEKLFPDLFPKK